MKLQIESAMGGGERRERLITLNIIGIVAGLIIIISVVAPWFGVVYTSGINVIPRDFSPLDLFTGSFGQHLTLILAAPPPPPIATAITSLLARLPTYVELAVAAIALLVVGAVVAFFHGFIGGGIGLIGLLIFVLLGGDIYTRFNTILPGSSFVIAPSYGFIMSWVAAVLALMSQLFRLKAPQMVSITVWRGRLYRGYPPGYAPGYRPVPAPAPREEQAQPSTQGYGLETATMIKCPKCGLLNSPGAKFCRNCQTRLVP